MQQTGNTLLTHNKLQQATLNYIKCQRPQSLRTPANIINVSLAVIRASPSCHVVLIVTGYRSLQYASLPYGITQCYLIPSRGDIPIFIPAEPIKAGTQFSDLKGMQGPADLVGLVTYRGGIPVQGQSPIPVVTGFNIE